ncbi:MAG TPA: flagellar hook-length control protein FliK [Firmicutes bacterium]|nr:flagellar hook-length control protein FliK [Bacillota bacterium]
MNPMDLALPAKELPVQQDALPGGFNGIRGGAKQDFRSVLEGLRPKTAAFKKGQVRSQPAALDSESCAENRDENQTCAAVSGYPRSDFAAADAAVAVDEDAGDIPFATGPTPAALAAAGGWEQSADITLHSGVDGLITLQKLPPGAEGELESAVQPAPDALAGEPGGAEDALFLKETSLAEGFFDGGTQRGFAEKRCDGSSEAQKGSPLPAEPLPDSRRGGTPRPAVRHIQNNRGSATVIPGFAGFEKEVPPAVAGEQASYIRPEEPFPEQLPAEVAAAGKDGMGFTAGVGGTGESLPADLSITAGSILERLGGSCTYFKEKVDFPAEVRIFLDPPELGEILIRVSSKEGRLSAKIIVEAGAVKEMLAGSLRELQQRFEQNELHFERIELFSAGEFTAGDHHFDRDGFRSFPVTRGSPEKTFTGEDEPELERASRTLYDGSVNCWA